MAALDEGLGERPDDGFDAGNALGGTVAQGGAIFAFASSGQPRSRTEDGYRVLAIDHETHPVRMEACRPYKSMVIRSIRQVQTLPRDASDIFHARKKIGGARYSTRALGESLVPRLQARSLDTPDETRALPKATADVVNVGEVAVGYAVWQPGWRWSSDLGPIAGTDWCETATWDMPSPARWRC